MLKSIQIPLYTRILFRENEHPISYSDHARASSIKKAAGIHTDFGSFELFILLHRRSRQVGIS